MVDKRSSRQIAGRQPAFVFYSYNIIADPNNIWGALGGRWSTPNVGNPPGVELTHPVSMPLAGASFSSEFAISHTQLPGTSRDKFGWSFKSGAADLVRVAFEPDVNPAKLEVVWYDPQGVRQTIPAANRALSYDSIYRLQVAFTASGPDAAFSAEVIPGVGPSLSFTGILAGQA